ncbi:MAG: secondary thiamine-phosphate synthase enzyme YjbQ [Acidobacteriota bacterium]
MDVITIPTQRRRQVLDVTSFVEEAVRESEVTDGLCHVWAPHTTAGVTVNENADADVSDDILAALEAMLPKIPWRHMEGNSDAHLLAALLGTSVTVPIRQGELTLGRWQGIFLVEFDGPRSREVWVTCVRS